MVLGLLTGNVRRGAELKLGKAGVSIDRFRVGAFGSDAAFTFYHNYSGPIFFIVSLTLLLPLSRAFHCSSLRSEVI